VSDTSVIGTANQPYWSLIQPSIASIGLLEVWKLHLSRIRRFLTPTGTAWFAGPQTVWKVTGIRGDECSALLQ